jgi:hypothetical protein
MTTFDETNFNDLQSSMDSAAAIIKITSLLNNKDFKGSRIGTMMYVLSSELIREYGSKDYDNGLSDIIFVLKQLSEDALEKLGFIPIKNL